MTAFVDGRGAELAGAGSAGRTERSHSGIMRHAGAGRRARAPQGATGARTGRGAAIPAPDGGTRRQGGPVARRGGMRREGGGRDGRVSPRPAFLRRAYRPNSRRPIEHVLCEDSEIALMTGAVFGTFKCHRRHPAGSAAYAARARRKSSSVGNVNPDCIRAWNDRAPRSAAGSGCASPDPSAAGHATTVHRRAGG